jgi:hypothetical protein
MRELVRIDGRNQMGKQQWLDVPIPEHLHTVYRWTEAPNSRAQHIRCLVVTFMGY